jgi:hypothetical protein
MGARRYAALAPRRDATETRNAAKLKGTPPRRRTLVLTDTRNIVFAH